MIATDTTPLLTRIQRKTMTPAIALAAMLGALFCIHVSAESAEHVSLSIPNMVCMSCEMKLEEALTAVDGVASVRFEGEAQRATVSFDANRASIQAILAASETAGYPATVVDLNTDASQP